MLKLTSLTLALLLAGCVSYQHPEPKEAKQTLHDARQQSRKAYIVYYSIPARTYGEHRDNSFFHLLLPPGDVYERCRD